MERPEKKIIIKALFKYTVLSCITTTLLLLSSWHFLWLGAWIIFGFSCLYIIIMITFGMKYFPETIIARSRTKFIYSWDKIVILIYSISYYFQYIISGFDLRYSWSTFHPIFFILGIILYLAAMGITFWVLAFNPYAIGSSRLQKERNQKVISNGPYRFLRHPMYFSTIFFSISTPLILDSIWAFITTPIIIGSFIFRCHKEDTLLENELDGYRDYTKKVRYRMIPFVW